MIRCLEIADRQAHVRRRERAELPGGWGRVRVSACGICGTDLHLLHGVEFPGDLLSPARPGHEVAGVVVEGADDRVAPGMPVVLHPLLPCGECPACRRGAENHCRTAGAMGFDHAGGLADEVIWPLRRMVPAHGIPAEQAALLPDAVATAYHALMLAALPRGGAIAVLGAGGVGAHVLKLARALDDDARLTAVVRGEAGAERLHALGIGIEVVVGVAGCARRVLDAAGPQDAAVEFGAGAAALPEALRMLTRGGRLVVGSISAEPLDLGTTLTAVVMRELHVIGTYSSTFADLETVVALASAGRLDLRSSVSHTVPLERAGEGLALLERRPPGLSRVVVLP